MQDMFLGIIVLILYQFLLPPIQQLQMCNGHLNIELIAHGLRHAGGQKERLLFI